MPATTLNPKFNMQKDERSNEENERINDQQVESARNDNSKTNAYEQSEFVI